MNSPFSRRERQVLQGLWEGLDQEGISKRLGIAVGTVKVVLRNARLRANVASTIALLRLALDEQIIR